MTKDSNPYEAFRSRPCQPQKNTKQYIGLIVFTTISFVVIFSILAVIYVVTSIEFEEEIIQGKVIDIQPSPTEFGYALITFDNGRCFFIEEGVSKIILNKTGTYTLRKLIGYDDLWLIKSATFR